MTEITEAWAAGKNLMEMPDVRKLKMYRARLGQVGLLEEGAIAFGDFRRMFVLTPFSVGGVRLAKCVDTDPQKFGDFWEEVL